MDRRERRPWIPTLHHEEIALQFMVEYPLLSDVDGGAWLDPENIVKFATNVEAMGLDAISLTDHPAPSKKWLDGGGHETFDPFAGLSFCAAVTRRIRLMTYLVVVPYRNPLLLAKSMTSLDVLSGGRATFVIGTGYLRSEFAALGVDFDERNELFDEAVDVLHRLWAEDGVAHEGRHFKAVGQVLRPRPRQRPHPPLWLGGNSSVVLDRVARWGQGWAPLTGVPVVARTARTPAIDGDDALAATIRELGRRLDAHGRSLDDIEIIANTPRATDLGEAMPADERVQRLQGLSAMGVGWTGVGVPRGSFDMALDALHRFSEEVAAKAR
jgi:probable F420-dependent oxidoreductase